MKISWLTPGPPGSVGRDSSTGNLCFESASVALRPRNLKTFFDELDVIQEMLDTFLSRVETPRILEAGCGSAAHLHFGAKAHLTGIDISTEQLDRNEALDTKILGDIENYPLPESTFDLIICFDVLEHLPNPEKALANFASSCAPQGMIILAMPNVYSFVGFVTKYTPLWFHVFVYRRFYHLKWAGTEGRGPFHTYLRRSISMNSIRQYAQENRFTVQYCDSHVRPKLAEIKERHRLVYAGLRLSSLSLKVLSLGKIDDMRSDVFVVLRKA
ncbi:MAG: class I SAM-dependent methyltransferase [Proteobacteria bacterium]|jgi:SAM-dependent methyltransferase|nr:class I SAM-dependent methyltransferase [Pseudomonadota bacterium]